MHLRLWLGGWHTEDLAKTPSDEARHHQYFEWRRRSAGLLALGDAAGRYDAEEVSLISFGPLNIKADRSFSELDVFWAVVEAMQSEVVEFYSISDKGDVTFAGRTVRPVDPYYRG